MIRIGSNRKAVSNILGYLFSFTIIALIMSSQIIFLTTTQNTKSREVAALMAQNIANQVADALVHAVSVSQSLPNARYINNLDVPEDLAGYSYNIAIDEDSVYVYTKDGAIRKSCLNYNTKNLNFDIRGRISPGTEGVGITYIPPDYIYKFDFGTGTIEDHSPVGSGYYMVSENSLVSPKDRQPSWWKDVDVTDENDPREYNYKYRIPIKIDKPAGSVLTNVPIKIVLSHEDIDIDKIKHLNKDKYNCVFYDPGLGEEVELNLDEDDDDASPDLGDVALGPWQAARSDEGDFIFIDDSLNGDYDVGEIVVTRSGGSPIIPTGVITDYDYETVGSTNDGDIFIWNDVDQDGVYGIDEDALTILAGAPPTGGSLAIENTEVGESGVEYYMFIDDNGNGEYDGGRKLPHSVDYISPEESTDFKGNIVFLVSVTMDENDPDTKYIYLYYGSNDYHTRNMGDAAVFFDDFDDPYRAWPRTYNGNSDTGEDVAYSMAKDNQDYIYVVGSGMNLDSSSSGLDWWIKKFDVNGYELDESDGWKDELVFDGDSDDDEALSVVVDGGDNVYVVGYGTNLLGNTGKDWWIKKFYSNGEEYPEGEGWNKIFDYGNNERDEEALSVAVDGDNNVYVVGYITEPGDGLKYWQIKKFNSIGEEYAEWDLRDGAGEALSVAIDGDNNVYIAGYETDLVGVTGKNWLIKKFDSDGNPIDDNWWNDPIDSNGGDDVAYSVAIDIDDPKNEDETLVYVAGYATNADGDKDWLIKKFNSDGIEDTSNTWDDLLNGNGGEDVAYSVAIEPFRNYDWQYFSRDTIVNDDPDGNGIEAGPASWDYGGLYAFDDPTLHDPQVSEPYIFLDTGDISWEYDGNDNWGQGNAFYTNNDNEYQYLLNPDGDPDSNAMPNSGDNGGYYALDGNDDPYIFKNKDGDENWEYNSGGVDEQITSPLPGSGDPDAGQYGGLYALDGKRRPYIFKDEPNDKHIYVVGSGTNLVNDDPASGLDWWIKKFKPDGTPSWTTDKKIDGGSNSEDAARSVVTDGNNRVYVAGSGTNLVNDDPASGLDWRIDRWKHIGTTPEKTTVNPEIWSILPYPIHCSYYNERDYQSYLKAKRDVALLLNYYCTIISKDYEIPPLGDASDDDVYIVEMKLYFGPSAYSETSRSHGGMIILSQNKENYEHSYLVSVRNNPSAEEEDSNPPDPPPDSGFSEILLEECEGSENNPLISLLDSNTMPFLKSAGKSGPGEGLIVRSYVYKDSGETKIRSFLYHPSTFDPYPSESIISGSDDTLNSGHIGLLYKYGYNNIDWVRVLKSTKNPPTVTAGAMESINYGWIWPDGSATSADKNPIDFCTDPVHYDFISVPIYGVGGNEQNPEYSTTSRFIIRNLPKAIYLITVIVGDKDLLTEQQCELAYAVKDPDDPDDSFDFQGNSITDGIPETTEDQFKRVWFTVKIENDDGGDIALMFYGDDDDFKAVSSILIEKPELIQETPTSGVGIHTREAGRGLVVPGE